MDLISDFGGMASRAEYADLWHRRLGHINRRSMDILRRVPDSGVGYDGDVQGRAIPAAVLLGKACSEPTPTSGASHDVQRPFQLVTSDVMEPVVPPVLGVFTNVGNFVDCATRWGEVFHLKRKQDTVDSLQLLVQALVIPTGW